MSQEDFELEEGLSHQEMNGENGENGVHESELTETQKSTHVTRLSGMYQDWFLDYASYVILERAVPHLADGLKPVHRRILHSMRRLDDGRYNKVANIIGHTMQFHPHGDASIGDALVQLGQKDLLIDTQGNWGNILTGDGAAAPRYIEARLTKFANEVVFNPKTTTWKSSYDGRNKEPITLPVKFPLLLAQGVEGIAVGLASKILPHNFNELIDASIAHLLEKDFELYPDFPTGGMIDILKYNEGLRGGNVRVRAKINKIDKKTLSITEVPYGKTTSALIETIVKANDKGKIKIKKIDDNTAENVEIIISLAPGISPDKTIDALYAFTDCELSISPNACIIDNDKPHFLGVKEILKYSVHHTRDLLTLELQIRLDELEQDWHSASLERIFIENELYEPIKQCKTEEEILQTIDEGLKPFVKHLRREVTRDDLIRLSNIPIKRISKYSSFKADEYIKGVEKEIEEIKNHLNNIIPYTINYYKQIKKKYGKDRERRTEIRNFDNIEATKVAVASEKLYVNRAEGFIGTGLRKEEYVCDCSDIDDIIVIRSDGKYLISKVSDKSFVGKDILYAGVFKKNDSRTIYNVVYRDGKNGAIMMKRCPITGLTRDKEYNMTKGSEGSKILYLTVNPNGEAETIKITLKPKPRLRNLNLEIAFGELAIKGKGSMGNILTKHAIHKIHMIEKGVSTLGGRNIWYDDAVQRLNADGRGRLLGEFAGDDKLLVMYKSGQYRLYGFDLSTHFEDDILIIEKYKPGKVFTAVYFDTEQNYYYLKRFEVEPIERLVSYLGDNGHNQLILLSDNYYALLQIEFGGKHAHRDPENVDADEFIAVKSYKAKGKRLSTFEIKHITELEPERFKDEEGESSAVPENIEEEVLEDHAENTTEEDITEEEKIIVSENKETVVKEKKKKRAETVKPDIKKSAPTETLKVDIDPAEKDEVEEEEVKEPDFEIIHTREETTDKKKKPHEKDDQMTLEW